MKTAIFTISAIVALVCLRLVAGPPEPHRGDPLQLRDLDRYVKITDEPFEMHDSTVVFCRPPAEVAINPHEPAYPEAAFCNVYVNEKAKHTMESGQGTYPVGSIVIKSKLATVDSQKSELFTVMQKMADGYDPDRGNWKYSVVDGTSFRQVASGRIDSCIECHEHYKLTDYITREYIVKDRQSK